MKIYNIIREEIARLNETAGKDTPDAFFDKVVQRLGGTPTAEKRKFFRAWKRAEGTDAKNNPLATTLKLKTSHGGSTDMKGSYNNGQPVQDYKTMDAGVDATFWTLKNTYGGKAYQNLVDKLKSNDVTAEELAAEKKELATWSMTAGNYVAKQLPYVADQEVPGPGQTSTKITAKTTAKTTALDLEDMPEDALELEASPEQVAKSKSFEDNLNTFQTILDFVGFVPVIGDAIDFANGCIYFFRGQYMSGTLSMIAVIPGAGSAIAVPLKVAFKSLGKIPKSVFIMLVKNPVGATNWWARNIWSKIIGKELSPSSLKLFLRYGDDILKGVNDVKSTLRQRGFTNLADSADDVGKFFKNMLDSGATYYDDITKAATNMADLTYRTGVLGQLQRLGTSIASGKLIKGIKKVDLRKLETDALNRFKKNVAGSKAFDDLVTQISPNFSKRQLKTVQDYLNSLAKTRGFAGVKVKNSADAKKILTGLDKSSKERVIDLILSSKEEFPEFYKAYTSRAGIQVANDITTLTAVLVRAPLAGVGKFFFNVNEFKRLSANVNVPKIFLKSAYIGAGLQSMDSAPQWVRDFGVGMQDYAILSYRWLMKDTFAPDAQTEETPEMQSNERDLENSSQKIQNNLNRVQTLDITNMLPDDIRKLKEIGLILEE